MQRDFLGTQIDVRHSLRVRSGVQAGSKVESLLDSKAQSLSDLSSKLQIQLQEANNIYK